MKAQVAGNDNQFGATAAHIQARQRIRRLTGTPLIIHSEQGLSNAEAKERAQWEVSTRMGRGKRAQIVVVGWRTGQDGQVGDLWLPNTLVRVTSPRMFLDLDLLITSCRYTLDETNARRAHRLPAGGVRSGGRVAAAPAQASQTTLTIPLGSVRNRATRRMSISSALNRIRLAIARPSSARSATVAACRPSRSASRPTSVATRSSGFSSTA